MEDRIREQVISVLLGALRGVGAPQTLLSAAAADWSTGGVLVKAFRADLALHEYLSEHPVERLEDYDDVICELARLHLFSDFHVVHLAILPLCYLSRRGRLESVRPLVRFLQERLHMARFSPCKASFFNWKNELIVPIEFARDYAEVYARLVEVIPVQESGRYFKHCGMFPLLFSASAEASARRVRRLLQRQPACPIDLALCHSLAMQREWPELTAVLLEEGSVLTNVEAFGDDVMRSVWRLPARLLRALARVDLPDIEGEFEFPQIELPCRHFDLVCLAVRNLRKTTTSTAETRRALRALYRQHGHNCAVAQLSTYCVLPSEPRVQALPQRARALLMEELDTDECLLQSDVLHAVVYNFLSDLACISSLAQVRTPRTVAALGVPTNNS